MAHKARKRFGQHFLHDPFIIRNIIDSINVQSDEHIIEIGPGLGALTLPLLELSKPKSYQALEIDRDVIQILSQQLLQYENFTLHEADALKTDLQQFLPDRETVRIIGNLPYNISTPLIFHLMKYSAAIKDMVFMLQKEVVERMAATPGTKAYGRLSVMTQAYYDARLLFDVPPGAFKPPPKVISAIVHLIPRPETEQLSSPEVFADIVRSAFNMRRKTIRNSLKNFLQGEEFEKLGLSSTLRAENLSVEDYVMISEYQASKTD